jgi:mannose-1-phosphate guanylyltransferase
LLRIGALDPRAIIAMFPSDHYISDNHAFMTHIRMALDSARKTRDSIVLLGVEPDHPEVEYGWIEPTGVIKGHARIFGVRRFWEKPNPMLAHVLQLRGCLWNSFVMVSSARALLDMIEISVPELYRAFACVTSLFGTHAEGAAMTKLYERLEEFNFSHQVLAHSPERLAVLKVNGVRWNDLGEPNRVMASLAMAGLRPHWADAPLPHFA